MGAKGQVITGARICVFAKPPQPGAVNTRLVPALGPSGAARLARAFLGDTLALARTCRWAEVVLATTGPMDAYLDDPTEVLEWPQGQGDLGARVERVLRRALETSPAALALGIDSPGLPRAYLERARDALATADAVIGPTVDGGFYTLGLTRASDGLLRGLTWSAPTTCRDTLARLRAHRYAPAVLPEWYDVDVPDDLERLWRELASGAAHAPRTAEVLRTLGWR